MEFFHSPASNGEVIGAPLTSVPEVISVSSFEFVRVEDISLLNCQNVYNRHAVKLFSVCLNTFENSCSVVI